MQQADRLIWNKCGSFFLNVWENQTGLAVSEMIPQNMIRLRDTGTDRRADGVHFHESSSSNCIQLTNSTHLFPMDTT